MREKTERTPNAAPIEVTVASVEQRDVEIYGDWVATLDGYVNAQIRNPGPIVREASVMDWPQPEQIPVGLPSQLLERRPDLQQAEAQLVAANADVGVAKGAAVPAARSLGDGRCLEQSTQGIGRW